MIVHRSYKYRHIGQISVDRISGMTKAEQRAKIKKDYGVMPRYSGETRKFYI